MALLRCKVSRHAQQATIPALLSLQANELIKKLDEDGEKYEEGFYFTAGYDAPFK